MNNKQKTSNGTKSIQNICTGAFSLLLLVSIAVCAICDMAISHSFTWSLYPISSIIFAWLVFTPIIRFSEKGICGSLISCSIFIVPFLYVLNKLIGNSNLFFPISIRISFIGVVYLWIIFILFKILKARKFLATVISLLLAIPGDILIYFTISKMTSETFDVWNIVTFFIIILTASAFFILDFIAKKKRVEGKDS